jgi:hypothetical protein
MIDTKVKTQTVTNTQLAVAVVAAFLAGGLAFAAAPAQRPIAAPIAGACVLSEASMVYTHAINKTRQLCPNNGYWGARFTCTDRRNDTVNVGVGNPCVTQDQILAMARAKCADQTHSCMPQGSVAQGTLSMTIDTQYGNLVNDRYALAGTEKFLAGRIKILASNEGMQIRNLVIQFSTNSPATSLIDLTNSINRVSLYSDPSMADNTLLAMADFAPETLLQGLDYAVQNGVPTYIYIGIKLNSVGIDFDSTAIPSTSFKVGLGRAGHDIRGLVSNNNIAPTIGAARSNDITIAPIKITNVASNFAGGSIVGGNQILGSFSITADGGRNTDQFGDVAKAHLLQLGLKLATDVGTALSSNTRDIQLCRVESGNCIALGTPMNSPAFSATTTELILVNEWSGTSTINMSEFQDNSDEYIDSGETANFVIRGTLSNTVDHFAQIKVVNLNTNGLVYGFDTDANGIEEYTFYDIRKDIPRGNDYPSVISRPLN